MAAQRIFALVDCNNFYCSCERVFDPKLRCKPVVVLSNNDGCAIARSEEAKKLGIKMGEPEFKIRDLMRRNHVHVFSSNYVLYGDMSHRVMQTLRQFTPSMEVYSIDEAFLCLEGLDRDLIEYAQEIRQTVRMWTGIPVSIGIGSTKVLAKAANRLAKKNPQLNGVLNLVNHTEPDRMLERLACEDVWGVGRQFTKLLAEHQITNALQLKHADRNWVRKQMGVVGERLVMELNGVSCMKLEEVSEPKKNICCSRSFGKLITEKDELEEAVANYVCRAAEKLRRDSSVASVLQVFLLTNPFRNEPQYTPQMTIRLPEPTNYTPLLITHALQMLGKMYRAGFNYNKAGVLLCDLIPETEVQQDLFSPIHQREQKQIAIRTVDALNRRMGKNKLRFGSQRFEHAWKVRAEHSSPAYTTRWKDLLTIKGG